MRQQSWTVQGDAHGTTDLWTVSDLASLQFIIRNKRKLNSLFNQLQRRTQNNRSTNLPLTPSKMPWTCSSSVTLSLRTDAEKSLLWIYIIPLEKQTLNPPDMTGLQHQNSKAAQPKAHRIPRSWTEKSLSVSMELHKSIGIWFHNSSACLLRCRENRRFFLCPAISENQSKSCAEGSSSLDKMVTKKTNI